MVYSLASDVDPHTTDSPGRLFCEEDLSSCNGEKTTGRDVVAETRRTRTDRGRSHEGGRRSKA